MNALTLRKLEYDTIRAMLAEECTSGLGRQLAEELEPSTDLGEIAAWQAETTEAVLVRRLEPGVPLGGIADLSLQIRKAQVGGMLEPAELLQLADLLQACRRLSQFFLARKKSYAVPRLEQLAAELTLLPQLEREIDQVVAPDATVRDTASRELLALRRKIGALKNRVREKLEQIVRSESSQKYLQDALVTIRDDRYVVPVKQEYRSQIPGIVHDQSASGATLFVEPMAVVELNNELRKATSAERDEVNRILLELGGRIAPHSRDLEENLRVLGRIDFLFAKARLSARMDGAEPQLTSRPALHILRGRHPLIAAEKVVPLDITLGEDFDAVILTGPNTGGKTVTLKTVGLFVLMSQSGLHLPAEPGSVLGVFHGVYADIGDEQSIEQSLSTFSSHMTNIVRILDQADDSSLVLLDELGAGTDPSEGAALAISILDELLRGGSKILATTHYSELKAYAFNAPRVQNACVEFDVETLRPTYRLLLGVPGKSNAFEIAGRLGLRESIIEQARGLLSREEQDVSELITSLETSNALAERNRQASEAMLAEIEAEKKKLEEERAAVAASAEKIRKQAREEALGIVRAAREESETVLRELRQMQLTDAKSQAAAQEKRKQLQAKEDALAAQVQKGPQVFTGKLSKVAPGQEVYVPRFSQYGTVLTQPDKNGSLQVQIGAIKVTVKLEELQRSARRRETGQTSVHQISLGKAEEIRSELDLRGLPVEEALEKVDKYLDDAYLSSLSSVRIIHGKGTGALRSAVREQLRHHPHVAKYYFADFHEGGDGVTVVELKK